MITLLAAILCIQTDIQTNIKMLYNLLWKTIKEHLNPCTIPFLIFKMVIRNEYKRFNRKSIKKYTINNSTITES